MNIQRLKKTTAGMAMALSLAIGAGIFLPSTVQAQYRGRDWQWERDQRRRQEIERARAIERERERARNRGIFGYPSYGGSGRYGNYSYAEEQRGYSKGFEDGREDGRGRRNFDPNRHSSFRNGNGAFRQGFMRGYEQAYRQYAGYRRW